MRAMTLVMGGARSGKSAFAQKLAIESNKEVIYIATAESRDSEMELRIANHKRSRPSHWHTIESPMNIGRAVANYPHQSSLVLLDCMTLLVSNILVSFQEEISEEIVETKVFSELNSLISCYHELDDEWVIVSNEVGLGIVPAYPLGRLYRDLLGKVNQKLAEVSNRVYFMVAGLPLVVK